MCAESRSFKPVWTDGSLGLAPFAMGMASLSFYLDTPLTPAEFPGRISNWDEGYLGSYMVESRHDSE